MLCYTIICYTNYAIPGVAQGPVRALSLGPHLPGRGAPSGWEIRKGGIPETKTPLSDLNVT